VLHPFRVAFLGQWHLAGPIPVQAYCIPCSSSAHRAPGKKATVPIYKVFVRPGRDSNPRPTSTEADALTTETTGWLSPGDHGLVSSVLITGDWSIYSITLFPHICVLLQWITRGSLKPISHDINYNNCKNVTDRNVFEMTEKN